MNFVRVVVFLLGFLIVVRTLISAVRTFVVPRASRDRVAALLMRSTVDAPVDTQADLCIRAGYLALRRIADFFA